MNQLDTLTMRARERGYLSSGTSRSSSLDGVRYASCHDLRRLPGPVGDRPLSRDSSVALVSRVHDGYIVAAFQSAYVVGPLVGGPSTTYRAVGQYCGGIAASLVAQRLPGLSESADITLLIWACLELRIFTAGSVKFEWAAIGLPYGACQPWPANLFTTASDSFHALPSTQWLALADGRLQPQGMLFRFVREGLYN